jgi:DNA-binding ferritin-like protein
MANLFNTKTKKHNKEKLYKNKTSKHGNHKKQNSNKIMQEFQKEITVVFFEILLMIKLFHWNTHIYATHKATDELYSSFNENMDKFIEILLGKSGSRIFLSDKKHIRLEYLDSTDKLKNDIDKFKSYLVNLDNHKAIKSMSNTDLLNIRDEILGNMNQFLYLLTFK